MLRKNLPALIRELKKLSGIEQVTLTTNGVLLKNFAPELLVAGLDGINLSLDTLDEENFSSLTRRKFLSAIRDGLQALLGKIPFKINCVPLRGVNDGELVKLAELERKNSVAVRFIELMPIGSATTSGLRGVPIAEIFSTLEKIFGELLPVREKNSLQDPAQYFKPKNFVGQIVFIDALKHKFCGNCNRIRLTATGFLKACLSFDNGLDVRNLLRSDFDDDKILAAIRETIYRKPREHNFGGTTTFQMYQVGG